ncbi:hypothetical protein OKA06_00880 [Novosphingobium sp. MW5]|nr:hypothetical protein [Novosphingobium sp. MW5]
MNKTSARNPEVAMLLHEFKQPLNIIRLANDNIRSRIIPVLDEVDATYLASKLERIERQIERAVEMIDGVNSSDPQT